MSQRIIKVQQVLYGVLHFLMWTSVLHGVQSLPLKLYYHNNDQEQQQSSVSLSPEPALSQDRMDSVVVVEDQQSTSPPPLTTTYTFPMPPPHLMPIFQPATQYTPPPNTTSTTKRMTRTATSSLSADFSMNFPDISSMGLSFLPPFLIPEYAEFPSTPSINNVPESQSPPPPSQPQFPSPFAQPQSQPISYQIPIINMGGYDFHRPQNIQNYQQMSPPPHPPINQYYPQSQSNNNNNNSPPQISWQSQPLSSAMEAAILQQVQLPQIQQPPMTMEYFLDNQAQQYQIPFMPPPQPPHPSTMFQVPVQMENYFTQTQTTNTQLPPTPKPELIHTTTTPIPDTTTTTSTTTTMTPSSMSHGLYSTHYGSSVYASSYKDYQPIISIEKFDHNITKDGYSVAFKTENGIDSKEEGHLVEIKIDEELKQDGVYSPVKLGVVHVKSGQVIWTSPECITFTLSYIANELGYYPNIKESPSSLADCIKYGKIYDNIGRSLTANDFVLPLK